MTVPTLGLDIGGANLKAAHSAGPARSVPFAVWKAPHALADQLRDLLRDWPPYDRLAATMTAETCDCFDTHREGVLHVLDAVASVGPANIWTTAGRFVDLAAARADPRPCAAANWLALATFAGRFAPNGPALLVDIGTTTSDLIPLRDGVPVPTGRTDAERLKSGELVYTGVRRTPACALMGLGGAAEFYATSHDIYLTLGDIPEDVADRDTADNRPATVECAHRRLAHMLGGDGETVTRTATQALAKRLALVQRQALDAAARRIAAKHGEPRTLILSGSGEFLARAAFADFAGPVVSLTERLGPERSTAACAVAVATLASEAGGGR
ncbi:MAG: hydantoinase/oxoprolinase family protein [Gemmataceae bacterium]